MGIPTPNLARACDFSRSAKCSSWILRCWQAFALLRKLLLNSGSFQSDIGAEFSLVFSPLDSLCQKWVRAREPHLRIVFSRGTVHQMILHARALVGELWPGAERWRGHEKKRRTCGLHPASPTFEKASGPIAKLVTKRWKIRPERKRKGHVQPDYCLHDPGR